MLRKYLNYVNSCMLILFVSVFAEIYENETLQEAVVVLSALLCQRLGLSSTHDVAIGINCRAT